MSGTMQKDSMARALELSNLISADRRLYVIELNSRGGQTVDTLLAVFADVSFDPSLPEEIGIDGYHLIERGSSFTPPVEGGNEALALMGGEQAQAVAQQGYVVKPMSAKVI